MTLSTNQQLIIYLDKLPAQIKNDVIKYNSLEFIYDFIKNNHKLGSLAYIENKARFYRNQKCIHDLTNLLYCHNLTPLFFKGIILAKELYDNPYIRMVGDIDFFVPKASIESVAKILVDDGFAFKYHNGHTNAHHWVLLKNGVVYEAHAALFNPIVGIDETCFTFNHFNKGNYYTFDETLTLLHLIFHLYMDCCLHLHFIAVPPEIMVQRVARFIYRSYEIVLFSEIKSKKIDWCTLLKSIKSQNVNDIFYTMLEGIKYIFPNFEIPL